MKNPTIAMASILGAGLLGLSGSAAASCSNKNYGIDLYVMSYYMQTEESGSRCANTADKFFDLLNGDLSNIVPSYDNSSIANAAMNFNGVQLYFDFAESYSGVLHFRIPSLGVDESFGEESDSRDDSVDMLVDYLKKSGILSRIMREQAATSPTSPIAGPGGMIPTAAAADFDAAMSDTVQALNGGSSSDSPSFAIGASYGSMDVDGKRGQVTNIPMSYVWRSDSTPGQMFTVSGSVTQVTIAGGTSYHGGLGVAFRMPVSARWALTPSLRYSITGSADMASVAGMYSAGLSSTYHIPLEGMDLVIGNMAGYYRTNKVSFGEYSFDPKIHTWSLRNGVMVSRPLNMFGMPLAVEYSFVDTRYTGGTEFFVDNTQEIGVTIGTNRAGNVNKKFTRFGVRYLHGRETNTVSLTGSFWF
jgi:hypothetical protein